MPTLEPQAIDAATRQALEGVTTATLTTVLLKKGLRNVWIRGALPVAERLPARRVGRAFTLRFVPAREDLATPASWASPISTRAAIEAMPAGAIVKVAKVEPMPKAGGKWNVYEITARGTQLTLVLNGVKTVDVQDSKLASGPFALQWGRGTIKFRKVQIRAI